MAMQFIKTLLHILPVQCTFSAASVRTAYNWSKLPNGTNSALLGYKCQDIEFILGLKMSTEKSMQIVNSNVYNCDCKSMKNQQFQFLNKISKTSKLPLIMIQIHEPRKNQS